VADRSCVALHHAVRDSVVACNHARPTNIAGVHRAAAEAVGCVGLEMTSAARRGVEGVNASAMKASAMEASTVEAAGMNTAAAMKAATAMEAAATTVETATATVETAATAAMAATTTTASTRLRHVR
jgi:hypothetical protein